jgi:hypothetical protein
MDSQPAQQPLLKQQRFFDDRDDIRYPRAHFAQ